MEAEVGGGFLRYFQALSDPRGSNRLHCLTDMLVIALCAVICGANGWTEVALFGRCKQKWFKTFLERFSGMPHGVFEETEGDHGRIETRRVWVTDEVHHLRDLEEWTGLASLVMVESHRQVIGKEQTVERRFYISSIEGTQAPQMGAYVRGHWGIENGLHWQLDVSFREDERRIRKGHGAENFSRLCRLGLNLLKRDKTKKVGIAGKRLAAGWDHDYLLNLLAT